VTFPNRCVLFLVLSLIALMGAFVPPCFAEGEGSAAASVSTEAGEGQAPAEEKVVTEKDLAKASQNPIADMISVPVRNTTNFGASATHNKIQNITTFTALVPIKLTPKWNIITRTVIPILYQPALAPGGSREFGVSDINLTAWVARSESRTLLWGLGPTLFLPTAMETTLGTGKWSAGPSVAMVWQPKDWVIGFLAYNVWSFAGYKDRASINQFLLQTMVNYILPKGWYLTTAPFLAANWKQPSSDRWMVPAGGGFGKIVRTRHLTLDLQTQAFYYVQRPNSESKWSLLFQMKFLFPKTLKHWVAVKAGDDGEQASEPAAQN
jgi:hypothetical protein